MEKICLQGKIPKYQVKLDNSFEMEGGSYLVFCISLIYINLKNN